MRKNGQRSGALHTYLRQVEKTEIEAALYRHHGNVAAAARELGRHPVGLWHRIGTLGIDRPPRRPSLAQECPRCGAPAGEPCRCPRGVPAPAETESLTKSLNRREDEKRRHPRP